VDALAPHISSDTLEFHYEKHHRGYLTSLNNILKDKPQVTHKSLDDLITTQEGKIFNLAAQVWNHTFYWNSMSPHGGGEPRGRVKDMIEESWESFQSFRDKFSTSATRHFGSGWAWLVLNQNKKLEIVETHDAGNPLVNGMKPILCCDVWEHAYYIDYRNSRDKYVEAWWSVVNWKFANENLENI